MGDNYEWELSKENIQPLKHGRNISSLMTALTVEDQSKHHRNERRKAMELEIMAYDGGDPLDLWSRYIQWVEENYPQGGRESDLLTVLEQCLEKLRDFVQYQSDPRLLDIYLRYLNLTESNADWYSQLFGAGYFHKLASFYIHWAETLEASSNFKEGTKIYQLGFSNKAEPSHKLEESFKLYQARVANAIFKNLNNPFPADENNGPSRNAFGELETETKAPVIRSGTTVRKFQNNRLLPLSKLDRNKPIFIHTDDENNPNPQSTLISSKVALPIQSVMKAENSLKPAKWTESHAVVNEIVAPVPAQPSFQVHVDDEVQPSSVTSSHRKVDTFSGALKDKSVGPAKLNPQTLFERENPKVKLMCDLNRLLVGHREFSFEEIRRQCYERSGKSAKVERVAPEKPVTPVSSAALLNVRSKEKKSRTPSEPMTKIKTPKKSAGPPPPLKPNEKWHCDIDALYPAGQELTFEQLRAQFYLSKIAIPKVESPLPLPSVPAEDKILPPTSGKSTIDSPETRLPAPSAPVEDRVQPVPLQTIIKERPTCEATSTLTTREVSVQTDLFGLDFDIQLVPRVKQEVKASSPPRRKSLSPGPVLEEQGNNQGSGSSPTVNTKQALSSVKSWFNSSVLVPELKPEQPKPAKKSLFSIFKDPSVVADPATVDVPDQKVAPKPFSIYTEPANDAIGLVQPMKKFTIMDENALDQENPSGRVPVPPKVRKPLTAIVPALPTCHESPANDDQEMPDDFKENVPPPSHVQETVKRQLSGILVPSVDIPCDPAGLLAQDEEEEDGEDGQAVAEERRPVANVNRALFMNDDDEQTRHYGMAAAAGPLSDDVDFTVPSAVAFAKNLRIQSTPLISRGHPLPGAVTTSEEATFNLPKGRTLQIWNDSCAAVTGTTAPVAVPTPAPSSSKSLRGLSPIDEISREYYSSSGSSAGTTGLAYSRLSMAGSRSSHLSGIEAHAGRVYPTDYDPFDMEHRNVQLTQLAIPLDKRSGFNVVSGRLPWLRGHSSVQLGGQQYIVKAAIGQGAYAKVYEALTADGRHVVLKVQETDGLWEFYVTSELQRRLADSPTADAVMTVDCGYFYDSGSILVTDYLSHGTLLDLINSYKLKNTTMPEPLVYHFTLQLLGIVSDMHECGILHADIKPDNIMLQSPLTPFNLPDDWTAEAVLKSNGQSTMKLIDFGRCIDLALYPERTSFLHVFHDDKTPEMRDGKPWNFQVDYYALACTMYTMLMGVHCKIIHQDGQWKVPTLKRGHNAVWRHVTTTLLNSPQPLDLAQLRKELAVQLVTSIKPREMNDKMRELERYLSHK